ncbi:CoA transferase [Alcaligenaceae bacterium CGII-47]|nr:CoA transferase [Alcaligenaceae bacterium CGII-47]
MNIQPLEGIKVLDFSTLLPGPLASLIMAEAGASVVKIERPGGGDDMRRFEPQFGADSGCFALLNRGKQSVTVDLKNPGEKARVLQMAAEFDVVIEQFRPGVMDRLGLGYEAMREVRPDLVYCSITGYGQTGPKKLSAGHDLNYLAETGMLSLSCDAAGRPVLPPGLIADIGGGALPAVFNILLALRHAEATGVGAKLDISMSDNIFAWQYTALALAAQGRRPKPGGELNTGGSPRYQIYPTADGRFIAAAPMEQVFWDNFCEAIGLPLELRDDEATPERAIAAIKQIIAGRNSDEWREIFGQKDVCCSIVATIDEAMVDPHFCARGLFDSEVSSGAHSMRALPVPLAQIFRQAPGCKPSPAYA